jgi:uncharacterized protein (DUF924 family)
MRKKSGTFLHPCAASLVSRTVSSNTYNVQARASALVSYWFGPMDDSTMLNREAEPFATYFMRWYGKNPKVDADIRAEFEGDLLAVTRDGRQWDATIREWAAQPQGLLALTLLLDQIPRNIYRDTPGMYTHDALGLLVSEQARAQGADHLPLTHQMFLSVPLMHVENLTIQQRMLVDFERFVELAKTRSPQNVGFYKFALDYAKRHVDVVEKYGRFPHRNAILGRTSTDAETEFLKNSDAYF